MRSALGAREGFGVGVVVGTACWEGGPEGWREGRVLLVV